MLGSEHHWVPRSVIRLCKIISFDSIVVLKDTNWLPLYGYNRIKSDNPRNSKIISFYQQTSRGTVIASLFHTGSMVQAKSGCLLGAHSSVCLSVNNWSSDCCWLEPNELSARWFWWRVGVEEYTVARAEWLIIAIWKGPPCVCVRVCGCYMTSLDFVYWYLLAILVYHTLLLRWP